jgi:electron transfer flavoprotein beta subunit
LFSPYLVFIHHELLNVSGIHHIGMLSICHEAAVLFYLGSLPACLGKRGNPYVSFQFSVIILRQCVVTLQFTTSFHKEYGMHIVVPIKQVPETSNVTMDPETGTMVRSGLASIINPLDLYAIEAALQLREEQGGAITALSMGPAGAQRALEEAVAMGCDAGILLSNKKFAGSDTWATSYALVQAIRRLEHADVIICGERATDGDTGQVGPGIAALLDLPLATYVTRLCDVSPEGMRIERMVEDGIEVLWSPLPVVLTVIKEIGMPRMPTLRDRLWARQVQIPVWGPEEIEANLAHLGLKGSPTRVVKIDKAQVARKGDFIEVHNKAEAKYAAERLVAYLDEQNLI